MKKLLLLFLAATITFTLAACNNEEDPVVDNTAPVISGADDVTIYVDEDFDPLAGITATDDVDGDITDQIEVIGTVDTTRTGTNYIRYRVEDAAGNRAEESRFVTVEVDPSLVGDGMVPNGDFELGTAFWEWTTGLEGGNATFDTVDGELVIDITGVSGGMWEPRLESADITFEEGVTYEVSFDAKADAPRAIHLQVGELLTSAPWFNDFKAGQVEIVDLTTEMQRYSYIFTMTQETNENGKVLFEMGTVPGTVGTDNLITTIYLDNVDIQEAEPVYSEPIFAGVEDITIEVGTEWDPLDGVTARDLVEGDLELTLDNVVSDNVNTEEEGTYEVTYTVSNSEGLSTTVTRTVTVVDLIFNETNVIANPNFEDALDDEDPLWTLWQADWHPDESPMSSGDIAIEDDALVLSVNDLGSWGAEAWLLQASQNIELSLGYTYRVEFVAKADAERPLHSVVGFSALDDAWVGYGGQTFNLTEEYATYSYTFTVDADNKDFQEVFKFEFGNGEPTIYIDSLNISVLEIGPVQNNGTFDSTGWNIWHQDWDEGTGIPTVVHGIVDGEYEISMDNLGNANWAIQFLQEDISVSEDEVYTVTFDARSDHARDINFKFIDDNGKEFLYVASLTEEMDTYTFQFTYDGEASNGKISIELGVIGDAVPGTVWFDNISMLETDTELVTNGTFDQLVAWDTWAQDWDNAPTLSLDVIDGELVIDMDVLGDEPWSIQLFQTVPLNPNATYTMMFDMRAEVARDINFKIIADGQEVGDTFSVTEEMQTFVHTFEYTINADSGNINFEFGNLEDAEPGAITIDNVILFRNFN